MARVCVAKSMGEMSLYMYILCGLDLRRLRRRSTQDLHTGVFQFHIGKTAKNY